MEEGARRGMLCQLETAWGATKKSGVLIVDILPVRSVVRHPG